MNLYVGGIYSYVCEDKKCYTYDTGYAVDKFTVADMKELSTNEKNDTFMVYEKHSDSVVHLIIVEYETGNVQVAFTGNDGVYSIENIVSLCNKAIRRLKWSLVRIFSSRRYERASMCRGL